MSKFKLDHTKPLNDHVGGIFQKDNIEYKTSVVSSDEIHVLKIQLKLFNQIY